jgi:hypothetical protein
MPRMRVTATLITPLFKAPCWMARTFEWFSIFLRVGTMIRQAGTNRDWQFRFDGYMIVGSNMLAFTLICFTARQDKTPG